MREENTGWGGGGCAVGSLPTSSCYANRNFQAHSDADAERGLGI